MSHPVCDKCFYSKTLEESTNLGCLRYPPTIDRLQMGKFDNASLGLIVIVTKDNWCGEYKDRDKDENTNSI